MKPTVTIVMPAYNAAALLPRTVPAACEAAGAEHVLVVDPGSTDDTAAVAESLGVRVLRLGRRAGPAEARNEGVATIDTDVALFVDSDCIAHPDVVARVQDAFADPTLVTLTGSYDDDPAGPGFFSDYMNLRHHHTHQHAQRDPATFWAGCGAVRVSTYRAVGGFDTERYPRPMIEDIELGLRMGEHGATRLDPALQVKHLKAWTMRSVIVTDIVHRAIPWTRLILERGMPNDLNLRTSQRIAAMIAPLALLSVPMLPLLLWWKPITAIVPAAFLDASLMLNWSLVRFFGKRRGFGFALGGWLFHQVHLTYSAVTFALVSLRHRLAGADAS